MSVLHAILAGIYMGGGLTAAAMLCVILFDNDMEVTARTAVAVIAMLGLCVVTVLALAGVIP